MGAIGVLFLIFILILLVGLFIFKQKSLYQQYCVKPDKPWDIPEEIRFLEKLKETDKEKYKETLNLMEEEYNSAVLWHKYYCESQIRSENRKKEKIRQERMQKKKTEKEKLKKEKLKILEEEKKKNKLIKEEKKKSLEEPILKEEKPEKPKKVEKEEVIVVDKKIDEQQLKKDRAFLRIKQEQEKQRRKLNKSNIEEREE
jgi:hypothetical protein